MKYIPACFFPTKVLLIDDNAAFLKELKLALADTTTTYKTYTDPRDALPEIFKQHEKDSYLEKWLSHGYSNIEACYYPLREQLYLSERFEQISTVIVDYNMPGMNGLEFCAQLKDLPIQKIMLTGEAEESIAINAFNSGLIQGFIKKDGKLIEVLNTMIRQRQTEFFTSLTRSDLEGAKDSVFGTLLQDPEFIKIFEEILVRFNIIEYYLMDAVGKFLLADAKGHLSALYAYSKEEKNEEYLNAESLFINGKDFVFPSSAQALPDFSYQEIDRIKGQDKEPHHSFPLFQVPGQKNYSWGYIPQLISLQEVYSFEEYKNSLYV